MSSSEELEYFQAIFFKGFWLMVGCNLFGLTIRIVKRLRGPGVHVE